MNSIPKNNIPIFYVLIAIDSSLNSSLLRLIPLQTLTIQYSKYLYQSIGSKYLITTTIITLQTIKPIFSVAMGTQLRLKCLLLL